MLKQARRMECVDGREFNFTVSNTINKQDKATQ